MSLAGEKNLLTAAEVRVLRTFRSFLVTPGQMLCFDGPSLKKNKAALEQLTSKDMLVKERFEGAYSLTPDGFAAMNDCT